ncbi:MULTISPECIES: motility protein A [Achromobacter]|uniref:MotA/TolQ/ExbB proton channel family protein n=1 Tax=Achromobacter spanius TaxID=217203 RepID=A0ABY8GXL4_9BURK|nr:MULTISPECIES: MotA/TolQ/ExbB proton channel family protein [Achromobacter]WAI81155.1 MotA/TolQ/ExbB proton channel family protein [Achromobacter spanius]WEX96673.1 MotA/TolQ/ExbB proton channel family protein [Achromobacter sp. SS2-2022]WFP09611.1 MotA/TolQ/ExbB proton channel family protein [Achromobacter spanius]
MNPSTLIGAAVGLLTLVIVVALSATDASMYMNLPGLAIVLGGTCAALFIAYPLSEVLRIFKLVRTVFRNDQHDQQRDIEELATMAQLWMNTDVRKVEQELKKVSNPFLRTGVQLIIDNTPEDQIIEVLQWRVARLRAREQAEAQMFRVMATFAPAFGMLGTLIALINMMAVLGDGSMATIGRHLAVGLMTTFYGILLANLICKPIALKLERRTARRVESMNMVLQGISMMCEKRGPAVVRETLNSFVLHVEDEIYDGGVAAPASNAKAKTAAPAKGANQGATPAANPPVSITRPAAARQ